MLAPIIMSKRGKKGGEPAPTLKLELKKFDMSKLKDDAVVVIIGKRGSGKSYLTKDILYHHRDIPLGTVISGTEVANGYYGDFVPKMLIHDEYSDEIMERIFKRQKKLVKAQKRKGGEIDPRVFLIFDDCLDDRGSWANSKHIRSIFMNGRHFKIFYLLIMQYPLGIGPNLRTNVDYTFILHENNYNNRKRLHENYAGVFPDLNMFCEALDVCTQDHGCMVIDNTVKTSNPLDGVFWYKASDHDDFKMCPESVWEYSDQVCRDASSSDSDSEEETEQTPRDMDLSEYMAQKKKGPSINVDRLY